MKKLVFFILYVSVHLSEACKERYTRYGNSIIHELLSMYKQIDHLEMKTFEYGSA